MTISDGHIYSELMAPFARYLDNAWHSVAERREQENEGLNLANVLGYFGDPSHDENGIRSMGNVVFAAALVTSRHEAIPGATERRVELLARARAAIGYLTTSHVTGPGACADGKKWGRAWQSAWWATKMALGARLIWHELSDDERRGIERVVASEADRQLERAAVPTGLHIDTKAEENAWDTEILATAVAILPEHAHHSAWRDKLVEFAMNTLSAPQDRMDERIVDGRRVCDQVYTVNLHSDFTLENHGAYHFCYVASPLVSIAWSVYAFASEGLDVPEALFHHVADIWERVKPTFVGDRFAYVSGKDWARYTYGLYFIVPALVMLQHRLADADARTIERRRLERLRDEQTASRDGSFFGARFTEGRYAGQTAKYETDCFADLGLAWLLHETLKPTVSPTPLQSLGQRLTARHVSPECGVCFQRTPDLFFSFSWTTLDGCHPSAQLIAPGHDDLADWQADNLLGRVGVVGGERALTIRGMKERDDGLMVEGLVMYHSDKGAPLYKQSLSLVLDAGRRTLDVRSKFIATGAPLLTRVEALTLAIPNDCFNGYRRRYWGPGGVREVEFEPAERPLLADARKVPARAVRKGLKLLDAGVSTVDLGAPWVNVDDVLGVIDLQGGSFQLRCPRGRNLADENLHVDTLIGARARFGRRARPGEVLLESHFLVHLGPHSETETLATGRI